MDHIEVNKQVHEIKSLQYDSYAVLCNQDVQQVSSVHKMYYPSGYHKNTLPQDSSSRF